MERAAEKYGYKYMKVFNNTYRIMDNSACSNFLIVGPKKAILIDTGCGVGNLRKLTDELTGGNYVVVNTHGHTDHVAANYQFDEIYIGKEDEDLMRLLFESKEEKQVFYEEMKMYVPEISEPENVHFSSKKYKEDFEKALVSFKIRYLQDGMKFDLGDTVIEAIHVPGHTPGGYVFLDTANRRLFVGDAVLRHASVLHEGGMSIKEFINGLEKLEKQIPRFDWVIAAHGHRSPGFRPLETEYISKLIRCAKEADIDKSIKRHEIDGDGYEYYLDGKCYADSDSVSLAFKDSSLVEND